MTEPFFIITGVTLLILLSPGPDMIMVLRNTLIAGRAGGLMTSAGVLTGNLVHIGYSVLGIGWLISESIVLFNLLKYAGATYLLYLGLISFRQGRATLDDTAINTVGSGRSWFMQGFINNVLNPKGALFYLGVFTTVITPGTSVTSMILLVVWMMMLCALFWLIFVTTLNRQALRDLVDRSHRWVGRVFGGLLIFLGVRVALIDRQ